MSERGDDLLQSRQEKLKRLRQRGVDPYPSFYRRTHTTSEAVDLFLKTEVNLKDSARTEEVSLAGRLTALRGMGKTSFGDLRDGSGRVQVLFRQDTLASEYVLLKDLDLGDFLGLHGSLIRTRTGEITVDVQSLTLLAKAIRPPPEKWHGLKDVEMRYRQRYLDLIASESVSKAFQTRGRIISAIRRFLDDRGFLEVETPILVPVAAGAMATPFTTHHRALDRDLYLRIATELYLKRLLVGGIDKVYEIGRVFRNEGIDADHNPEFTLLESYEAYADYNGVMSMVEEMVSSVADSVMGQTTVIFEGQQIDLAPPWRRLDLQDAVAEYSGIRVADYPDAASLAEKMREVGVQATYAESRGRLIDKLVSTYVEPLLIQPTFLVDYPVEMSPLAKGKPDNPEIVERFEGFAAGMEIANAFSELNDPRVQRERMEEQERLRKTYQGEDLDRIDEDFLLALEHGMPPAGGLGIGIDRLVMLLTGQSTIRDVLLFPQLRTP